MQYLAELKKEKAFVGFKAEIKLLARNTSDNNWQSVGNDETIPVSDANQSRDLKDGQMVLVEIANNKSIQSIQEASKRVVLLLQNFSKFQGKFKEGEEEIEQWKQSLSFQSQELHRREVELSEREQELEHLGIVRKEAETEQFKAQREREEVDRLRRELEILRRDFDRESSAISQDQADHLQELTTQIANFYNDSSSSPHQIDSCLEILRQRQETLNGFWQEFETLRQFQSDLNTETQKLNYCQQQLRQTQARIIDFQSELKSDEEVIKAKETILAVLELQISSHEDLANQLSQLITSFGGTISQALDPAEAKRLEQLPINDLEAEIHNFQREFDKGARAVGEQEEELAALEADIAEFQSQIETASGGERIELESSKELAEENYQFLESSLSGMRANMLERQALLSQQCAILERRQGISMSNDPVQNLMPMLAAIEVEKSAQILKLREISYELDNCKAALRQKQESSKRLNYEFDIHKQELDAAETALRDKIRLNAEASSYKKILQPVQDAVDILRNQMETALGQSDQADQAGQAPLHLIENLRHVINELVSR